MARDIAQVHIQYILVFSCFGHAQRNAGLNWSRESKVPVSFNFGQPLSLRCSLIFPHLYILSSVSNSSNLATFFGPYRNFDASPTINTHLEPSPVRQHDNVWGRLCVFLKFLPGCQSHQTCQSRPGETVKQDLESFQLFGFVLPDSGAAGGWHEIVQTALP